MRTGRTAAEQQQAHSGIAMVAVLLVLMALFVLCAPFLVTVRNADQASAESSDRAFLGITLDAGSRHAVVELAASHPSIDETPYHDALAELEVTSQFPEGFLPTDDPSQTMWDVEASDVAARVDLSSASPHVLANLIGGAARLAGPCTEKDVQLSVLGADGMLSEGVVFVDDEVMAYGALEGNKLLRLERGLLVETDPDGNPASCGPSEPKPHDIGAFAIDQRAWALAEWRLATGSLRVYESIEQVREARDFVLAPEFGREAYLALERSATPWGHVRAGATWQRPARVVDKVGGQPDFGCRVPVDDVRWFNAGTTVRITDGRSTELALVRRTEGATLVLTGSLRSHFEPYKTIVAPLARTPVNVNTASPEVLAALWTNLKLRGKSARITSIEAEKLVDLAIVSRPFTGFEDFLRRLVLPAGGLDELPGDAPVVPAALEELSRSASTDESGMKTLVGIVDADDAIALYKNALNANDNELEFSTMPLCFTSRDVYDISLRASVNAPSGIERARGVRQLVELIVPQQDLLSVWTRQEDFDEAPRLDGGAAGWMTGPVPTSRPDGLGAVTSMRWPTRARAHLGAHDTQPSVDPLAAEATFVYSFAERDNDDGWAQLAPWREDGGARGTTMALHFDDESKVLEGRFLPDSNVPLDLTSLGWTGAAGLMAGMSFDMWIKPQQLEEGAHLLDLAGRFTDADRVSLLFEGGDLLLRVYDGAGDHPTSGFVEESTIRFPLAGEGAGIPPDTWSHVKISVDGNRPDQMALWVDGRRAEKTPGLTRLTSGLSAQSDTIQVESTEGFPDKCVLRIGDELIEVLKRGEKTFTAKFNALGENSGFGGRIARERFAGVNPEVNQGLFKDVDHPSGASVQLYGYSLPLFSNVPNVQGTLDNDLAMFAVARVEGVLLDGSERRESGMEPILFQGQSATSFTLGWGFDAMGDELDGLILTSTDPNRSIEETMGAFDPNGGYAAVLGIDWNFDSFNGERLGGVEVVRYSGWDGQILNLTARGGAGLQRLAGDDVAGRGAFIIEYAGNIDPESWTDQNEQLSRQVMVIPISIPVRSSGASGFDPANNGSAFAQITHTGGESHLTEWVRYDEISAEGFLVRSDPTSLIAANTAAHAGISGGDPPTRTVNPPAPPRKPSTSVIVPSSAKPIVGSSRAAPLSQQGQSYWYFAMGEADDVDFPVARAVNSQFQFRGVLGTHGHTHPSGTMVLPVFFTRNFDVTSGIPGRFDSVMFMSVDPSEPGFPGVVQHAHQPFEYEAFAWLEGGSLETPVAVPVSANFPQSGFATGVAHVALDARLAVPFASVPIGGINNPIDNRLLTRICMFPSGELPRVVQEGSLGGDVRSGGGVPAATVDEALFYDNQFGNIAGMPGQLVLARAFSEGDTDFRVLKDTLRTTYGDQEYTINVLANLPENGGMLRIGDEFLCYDSYTVGGNLVTFTIPGGGRGLLGSEPQGHRPTEGISYISSIPVGILVGNLGPDDGEIPLLALPPDFPPMGMVWIDGELVHYTRVVGNVLEMPRASSEPGEMDAKGPGLFRGRYGTPRAAHAPGTPVVLFSFRYWDGWSDLADAPEMTWLELSREQPDAYWKRVFWKAEAAGFPGPELGVLQRTNPDTPWDEQPEDDNGLSLLKNGKLDVGGNRIEVQADRVQWRVFVRHLPGSFDALEGLAHGWKTTPRLELFGTEYMGPNRTLSRVDR